MLPRRLVAACLNASTPSWTSFGANAATRAEARQHAIGGGRHCPCTLVHDRTTGGCLPTPGDDLSCDFDQHEIGSITSFSPIHRRVAALGTDLAIPGGSGLPARGSGNAGGSGL
jgi:hypothetical protein